jgi:hypothetical protein
MALRVVLAAVCAAMAVSPGVAGAVTVAPGPGGRALLTWST